jgi:hypothetical protein
MIICTSSETNHFTYFATTPCNQCTESTTEVGDGHGAHNLISET